MPNKPKINEAYINWAVELEKIQQLVGQIPWSQNILIMSKSNGKT